MSSPERKIIIIAGPNGAGKTTFANQILAGNQAGFPFVNADIIARGLNPNAPESEPFRAGRLMLQTIEEPVEAGKSLALEATLSGLAYSRSIPRWQGLGYRV
jgi:predicted ABC-type ATPase